MGLGGGSASVTPLAPRPAVPLWREEEEEVGIARFSGSLISPACTVLPADRAAVQPMFPPLSATLPSVTVLPLLFAPQTRERGRAVGAGRRLQLPVLGSDALGYSCFREVLLGGLSREERGWDTLAMSPSLSLLSELQCRHGSRAPAEAQESWPVASPHPAPVDPLPRKARTQITLVLPPLLDPARASWLIKFKLREVKLCARGV